MAIVRVHVLISGRVQGVYFRGNIKERAKSMGITGWVRNLASGQVEAVFEGDEEDVRKMVTWCHKGPSAARVDDVSTEWETPTGEESGFEFRGTFYG